LIETFIVELESAVEALVKTRLREAVQSLHAGEGGGRAKGQAALDLRAALGASPIAAGLPAVVSAGRVATETPRARPGRCVGVITGGRRCGRAAPPGDPPLCSFCRATVALVAGGTARVSITVSPPVDGESPRPPRIQLGPPGPPVDTVEFTSRKERCKGVLLGGGSCRSRVMPPDDLCPWCRALGVRSVGNESPADSNTRPV
jgi:hypothetical protein